MRKCTAEEAGESHPVFEPVGQRFTGLGGPLEFGADLRGDGTGGKAALKEFIGQRHANHSWIDGIRDGRGNRGNKGT